MIASRAGLALAFALAVVVFAFSPATAADDETPQTPAPTASSEPDNDSPLVELEPGLTPQDDDALTPSALPACGDLEPCEFALVDDQFRVVAVGGGFILFFLGAHVVGSWRHGKA